MQGEDEAEETDELVQQVLDEIGITNMAEVGAAVVAWKVGGFFFTGK